MVWYSPLQMWEVVMWQGGVRWREHERVGRPQLWDQATWPPTPSSWGIKEGIPCVTPPRFRELLDIMISWVMFAFDTSLHRHRHTRNSALPITGYQGPHLEPTSESLLSFFGISLPVSQTKTSSWHPILSGDTSLGNS